MQTNRRTWAGVVVTCLLFAVGCSDTITVSGSVNAGGQPVPYGWIGFAPAEGQGPRVGGQIVDGHYTVDGLKPGKTSVTITGQSGPPALVSRDPAKNVGLVHPTEVISLSHPKNGQIVEVNSSTSSLDFDY